MADASVPTDLLELHLDLEDAGNQVIDPPNTTGYGIHVSGDSDRNFISGNMVRARSNTPAGAIRINDSTCDDNVVRNNSPGTLTLLSDSGTGTITS